NDLRPQLNRPARIVPNAVVIEERITGRGEGGGRCADARERSRLLIEQIVEFGAELELLTAFAQAERLDDVRVGAVEAVRAQRIAARGRARARPGHDVLRARIERHVSNSILEAKRHGLSRGVNRADAAARVGSAAQVEDCAVARRIEVEVAVTAREHGDRLARLRLEDAVNLEPAERRPQELVTELVEERHVVAERSCEAVRDVQRRTRALVAQVEEILRAARIDRAAAEFDGRIIKRRTPGVRARETESAIELARQADRGRVVPRGPGELIRSQVAREAFARELPDGHA